MTLHPDRRDVLKTAALAGVGLGVGACRTGGAAWTALVMLSERSIAERSRSVDFPDFTRGAWKVRPPLGIVDVDGRLVAARGG